MMAQERAVVTTVSTVPSGLRFYVDGQSYKSTQAFAWTAGSKHTILIDSGFVPFDGQRFSFTGWSDNAGTLNSVAEQITVTADPAITSIKATFTLEYQVRVLFYACNSAVPQSCRPPGTVTVGGSAQTSDYETWAAPDSTLVLVATPNPGFVFNGWGEPSNYSTSPVYRHTVTRPVTFSGMFAPGKRVTLVTNPPDLLVAPDRSPTKSPADVDWGAGSRHILGVVSPQTDEFSRLWVFSEWSNGMKANDVYTVGDAVATPEVITAHYVPGARASFVTSPVGLKLKIDGRDNWPAYNFVWGLGMKYSISAPAEQTDARGRRYVFKGWSNGGPAAQEVTVTQDAVENGFRLIAEFEPLNQLSIQTVPPGLPVTIDGKECRGQCIVEKTEGSRIEISAVRSVPFGDNSRAEFSSWSDGGDATRIVTIDASARTTLTANYRQLHKLTVVAEPGNGAQFKTEPVSTDGYFETNTNVTVTAEPKAGYRFRRWEGDLAGTFRTGQISMSVPRVVRAVFDSVPFADERGARNSAGDTPEKSVAPGSVASIFGVNLAPAYQAGPANPLAQTIGSVTLRLNNRLLPLVFVSPEQINFQVPSDLADGSYDLFLRSDNGPELKVSLTVARNAPGLFAKIVGTRSIATAVRADGSEIRLDSPAAKGDIVNLFGTGFGPYERPVLDGFALPPGVPYRLLDSIDLLIGDATAEVNWAGGAVGQVGTAMVRFKLPDNIVANDGVVPVRVRINGHESNTVLLPVQ